MRRTNKAVSIVLLICMMMTILPSQVFAESETELTVNEDASSVTTGSAITTEPNEDGIEEDTEITTEIGTIVLRFEDENGFDILPEDTFTDMELGEYTFNAPEIEGYTANENSQTTILTYDGDIKYIVFTYTENEKEPVEEEPIEEEPVEEAQLRVILADCTDIQDLGESLNIFMERSRNETHNVMDELYYDLDIGENDVEIPITYNGLEWNFTGSYWDSEFDREDMEDEQGSKAGIKVIAPYLDDLDLFIGYVEPEKPEPEQPIIEPDNKDSRPSIDKDRPTTEVKEEPVVLIEDTPQENFVARYVGHKVINEKFIKSAERTLSFEIDKTFLEELLEEGLTPRIYRWNEKKGKLIAEDTKIELKQGTDDIYVLTSGTNRLTNKYLYGIEEYYTLIAVKQPNFADVKEHDYFSDKANGLGIIEGVERDGIRYFEGEKSISRSEFYTMIARIFGAVPDGETKIYDLLDFKTMDEADEILKGLELGIADWAKPYVASLYEKGYITEFDIKEADNSTWNHLSNNLKIFEKLISDVEDIENNGTVDRMLHSFKHGNDIHGFPTLQYNKRYNTIYALINILIELGW